MKKGQIYLLWFTIVLAIASICVTLFVRIIPTVPITNDAYIGAIVTLLALCTTFVIGYQIVNILDIKESIKDLEVAKKEIHNTERRIKARMLNFQGASAQNAGNIPLALCFYLQGLNNALKCEDKEMYDVIISNMRSAIEEWNGNDALDFDSFTDTIGGKRPIERIIELFNIVITDCSSSELYDLSKTGDYKRECETLIDKYKRK